MQAQDKRPPVYRSASGIELKASYGPEDVPAEHTRVLGSAPGQPPFHRGGFPQGYRTKPWRIFQLSGFGKPEDENERIKFLLRNGETGFLMEHDRNTADHLYNVDHPDVVARKEDVGLTGAVMQSVRETALCLADLPIESTFGHAGGAVVQHAPFALAAYWTVAKRRGIPLAQLFGTGQSDFFLTYLGCVTKQQVPTAPGLRLNADIIEFCAEHLPKWVPVSIAGYNGGDTGLNAWQELGAVMANAIEYLDEVKRRGRMDMTVAAQRVGGVNFRTTMEIFEDAAKLRAARKMWHKLLTERYGITDERALKMRIHIVTSGAYMQYQQPFNNIVRGTLMALTAVLGGTQSLGVSGYDEAISIPSEHAHQMSVRIQQILEHETNIPAVTDPLGGSYYVEVAHGRARAPRLGVRRPVARARRLPGHARFRLAACTRAREPGIAGHRRVARRAQDRRRQLLPGRHHAVGSRWLPARDRCVSGRARAAPRRAPRTARNRCDRGNARTCGDVP